MRSDAESPDPGADGDGTATFEPADLPDDPQLAVEELIADADVDLEELASNVDDLVYVAELTPAEAAESAATEVDPHAVIGGPAFAEDRIAAKTWALFLGLALVMIGNGLQGAVLGLRSEAEGFGVGVTGLVMTAYFCGFLVGSRYAEHAVQTVGHIRTFSALASTASATALVHVLIVEPIIGAARKNEMRCGVMSVAAAYTADRPTRAPSPAPDRNEQTTPVGAHSTS